ncbi:MAG: acyl-CoA dehydrogenase family protein [Chloroflexota bacterium]|nr:acyl-CoA dehydrogenase family protein [Chloroflexota bacterium]
MEFEFTKEQDELREEVREVIEKHIKLGNHKVMSDSFFIERKEEDMAGAEALSKEMAEHGWCGMTWPKENGGREMSYLDRLVVQEECQLYSFMPTWFAGDRQMGPSIMKFGTKEQKEYFLPKLVKGELTFGIGMSEPEAGSDLAALKTTAIEKEDHFLLNGQKVWTSGAATADYLYLVARTDPDPSVPGARACSEFLLDLKLPGIDIRRVESMNGSKEWCEVFFTDVKVPKSALVGTKNKGFYQIMEQLDYERAGIERIMFNYALLVDLTEYVKETKRNDKPLSKDPLIRQEIAKLWTEFEVGRLLIYRVAWVLTQGKVPNVEAAMAKAYATAFCTRLANTATRIMGLPSLLRAESSWAPIKGQVCASYLCSPGYTLAGGSEEVLKNVLARRGLGLPRE